MSEENKQKLKEYQRKYGEARIIDKIVVDNKVTYDILLSTTTNIIAYTIF